METKKVVIKTEVPEYWLKDKELHAKTWKEIIGLGILATTQNPQILDRIHEIETRLAKIENLYYKIDRLIQLLEKER